MTVVILPILVSMKTMKLLMTYLGTALMAMALALSVQKLVILDFWVAKKATEHVNANQNVNGKDPWHLVSVLSVSFLPISLLKEVHNGQDLQHAHLLTVALIMESLINHSNIQWAQFAVINANNTSI